MKQREVLLILTEDEHRRLVELTLPSLASTFDDTTKALILKLTRPRPIHDIGDRDGNEEGEHRAQGREVAPQACGRCNPRR